ncbi:U11/U12 small nuclear ribonucleoprotein 48 kDa protein-like isoform X2 [Pistacia vera]|nr:U11/U12 small nuclear ribonucleoprotein 48 kDa protein-like isoform X2 [Pistacia vera]
MAEHAYVSNRANEERKKRPSYRPIIEHDVLPKKQSSNQEQVRIRRKRIYWLKKEITNAEECHIVGKKLKRTTLKVMRDIIEEHMDEIKQAGGISCFVKGDEEVGMDAFIKTPCTGS